MLRQSRSTLTVVDLLISLGGCSAILGIEPTAGTSPPDDGEMGAAPSAGTP